GGGGGQLQAPNANATASAVTPRTPSEERIVDSEREREVRSAPQAAPHSDSKGTTSPRPQVRIPRLRALAHQPRHTDVPHVTPERDPIARFSRPGPRKAPAPS